MTRIYFVILSACVALGMFAGTAFAANAVSPDDGTLLDLARPIFDAIMNGQAWLAAALAVVFATAATRKYLPDAYGGRFIRGDVGGVLTAFSISFGGALATALAAGSSMSGQLALTGLKVALAAAGGYSVLHKLASAMIATKWYQSKAPAWLKTIVAFALGMLGSSAAARAKAIDKSKAAGSAAVAAKPAQGVAGVVGKAREVE